MDTIAALESVSDRWVLEEAVIALLQVEEGQQYLANLMSQASASALGKLLNLIMWRCSDRECARTQLLDPSKLPQIIRETVDNILSVEAGSDRSIAALSFYTFEENREGIPEPARHVARGIVDRSLELEPDTVRQALKILDTTGDLQNDLQLRDAVLDASKHLDSKQGRAALGFAFRLSPESARDLTRLVFESDIEGAFTVAAAGLYRRYNGQSQPDGMEDEIVGFITQALGRAPKKFAPFCKEWLVRLSEVLPNRQSAYDLISEWARATEPGKEREDLERMAEKIARGESPRESPMEQQAFR